MVGSFLLLALIAWHVDARGGQLSLTWVDTSSDASGFAVERSMEGTGAFAEISRTGPNVTAYTDFPLADATTYCYRVRAFNSVGYSDYSNPACGTAAPPLLALALDVNQQAFALGDSLQVDVTLSNAGPATVVDVYFGILLPSAAGPALGCPNGDAVAFLADMIPGLGGFVVTCRSSSPAGVPLYDSVPLPGKLPAVTLTDFFGFDWPPGPAGDYTFFMTFTEPGTTNVIALGTATVSYAP